MKKYSVFLAVMMAAAAIFFSCKKEFNVVATASNPNGMAFLKIVHASPNFTKVFTKPDGLNVYVGSATADTGWVKVNGPALTFKSAYPAVGSVNTYASVLPGDDSIRIVVSGVVNPDSITVFRLRKTLAAGSYYTLLLTDSMNRAQDSAKVWAPDNFPASSAGNVSLRFVNMVLDAPATDTMNLYSKRRGQILFPSVLKDSITPFASFPTLVNVLDSFYVQRQGVTMASLLPTALMRDQMAYTIYYIGDTAKAVAAKTKTMIYVQNQ